LVLRKHRLQIAAAIGPCAKLLNDPGGETCRGVGERERKRLRPRPLDPLVTGSFLQPCGEFFEVFLLLGCWIGHHLGIASQRHHVEMNADQPIPYEYASREVMNEPQSPPWAPKRL